MANLVLLCPRHHHAHHDGDFTIVAHGGGRFRFVRDGRVLERDPNEMTAADATPVEQEHRGLAPSAATTRWDGSRLDHDFAVWGLAQHLDRRRSA
jgi:hypothetical protein